MNSANELISLINWPNERAGFADTFCDEGREIKGETEKRWEEGWRGGERKRGNDRNGRLGGCEREEMKGKGRKSTDY